MFLHVQKVKISENRRNNMISFTSAERISIGVYVVVTFNKKEYYFQVSEVSTGEDSGLLYMEAKEVGYYNSVKHIDIRELIGKFVKVVTDEDINKKIKQESQYC